MNATLKRITETPRAGVIIKDRKQRNVTSEQLRKVRKLIYYCSECKTYHLWDGNDFEDIEVIIGK